MTVDAAVDAQTSFETEAIPYMRLMFPAALRLTRDRCDAEDLLQETFARAYQKFHLFTPGTNLRAWLHRIMFHTFYSTCRKRRSRPLETLAGDLFETQDTQSPTVPPTRSAEAEAMDNLAGSPAMRALRDLPGCFKTVVYLADVEGYRYAEIAELMGTPLGTVMSRIHRGRQMLRSRLAEPAALATVSPVRPAAEPAGADSPADAADAGELDPGLAA
jgi:RNA polymerase sigma-70 factor, ECF subfamily